MAASKCTRLSVVVLLLYFCAVCFAKINESNETKNNNSGEVKTTKKVGDGVALVFADEFKQTLERYLFGICPQTYKISLGGKGKNTTTLTCDLDTEQHDLAGRLAALALRAHSAARSDCTRFGAVLANTLGELARTAANRQAFNAAAAAANDTNKKRKLSKSQKMKIQAKQRTALAVKKKAAAVAAAAAAKMAS